METLSYQTAICATFSTRLSQTHSTPPLFSDHSSCRYNLGIETEVPKFVAEMPEWTCGTLLAKRKGAGLSLTLGDKRYPRVPYIPVYPTPYICPKILSCVTLFRTVIAAIRLGIDFLRFSYCIKTICKRS